MKQIAILLLWVGLLVFVCFIVILWCNGYRITTPIDMAATGQIGDFIGGVVGTIWSLSGILFIYATFKQQNTIIQRDYDKFIFEILQSKSNNEVLKLYSLCFNEKFEDSYSNVNLYMTFQNVINHSECLGNLHDVFNNNNPLINSLNSFSTNLEKVKDTLIKQMLVERISDIIKTDTVIPKIELIVNYLNKLQKEFESQTQKSPNQKSFKFEGELLYNFDSDSYQEKIKYLNQLQEILLKFK